MIKTLNSQALNTDNGSSHSGQSFSDRLRKIVEITGSVSKLAKCTDLSPRVIGKYLAEESDPSRKRLIAIAKATNINLNWLATGEGPQYHEEKEDKSPQPEHHIKDPDLLEIVEMLKEDPNSKEAILRLLRGKKEMKEALVDFKKDLSKRFEDFDKAYNELPRLTKEEIEEETQKAIEEGRYPGSEQEMDEKGNPIVDERFNLGRLFAEKRRVKEIDAESDPIRKEKLINDFFEEIKCRKQEKGK